jgi:GDPmannose 4,6-dehydratase
VEVAFDQAGIAVEDRVVLDPAFVRPAEVERLIGDHSKATEQLGWTPTTDFETMIRLMVDADIALLTR